MGLIALFSASYDGSVEVSLVADGCCVRLDFQDHLDVEIHRLGGSAGNARCLDCAM